MSEISMASSASTTKQKPYLKPAKWVCWTDLLHGLLHLLVIWFALALPGGVLAVQSTEITQATVSTSQQPQPRSVSLPHRWDKEYSRQNGTATYTLAMPAPQAGQQELALYVPRVGNQAQFYVLHSGQRELLVGMGALDNPLYDAAKMPHWILLPRAMLQPGEAWQLQVEIAAQSGRYGGLSSVHVGQADALRPHFERNHLWRQTSSQVIVLALGLLGLLAAGLWWRQREASFALFAITALLGMIRMSDRLITNTFLPWPWWGAVMATAYAWHLLFMIRFSLQTAEVWSRKLGQIFWSGLIATAAAAFVSFGMHWPLLWTVTLLLMAVPAVYALVALLRRWRQPAHREAMLLSLCGLLLIGVGVRDFVAVRLAAGDGLTFSFMPMALFAFVLSMAWIIVERFSRQVQAYRELNTSLEQRVAERDAQLQQSYEQLKTKDQEQATLAERARIMRDIHDGVGAQLVGLVSMLQAGQKAPEELHEHAQAALDELRMAVDSLQPVEGSLSTVLATLRYRLGPRLQAAGLSIQWDVDELPRLETLTPGAVLQVQKILLEAFTNIIRHAQARVVQVSARHLAADEGSPERLSLCVDDDGQSPSQLHEPAVETASQTHASGHGLNNMRWRAQAIRAQLHMERSPLGGTRIRLEWPLLA
jgi:signal transduction histidine kinase